MSASIRRPFGRFKSTSGLAAFLLVIGFTASPALAGELIPVDPDGVLYAPSGSRTTIAEQGVDEANIGQLCTLSVLSQNGSSIHAGNDLVVTTGGVESIIADVEAEPDASRDLTVEIVMGDTISVDLLMGPDGLSSFGFDLSVDCPATPETEVDPAEESAACEPEEAGEHEADPSGVDSTEEPTEDCPHDEPAEEPAEDPTDEPAVCEPADVDQSDDPADGSTDDCPHEEPAEDPPAEDPTDEPAVCEPADVDQSDDPADGSTDDCTHETEADPTDETEVETTPETVVDATDETDETEADPTDETEVETTDDPRVDPVVLTPISIETPTTLRTTVTTTAPVATPSQSLPAPRLTIPDRLAPPALTPTPSVPDPGELQVLGILTERELPSSAPATAIPVTPKYNG